MNKKSIFLLTESDLNLKIIKKIKGTRNSIVVPLSYKVVEKLNEENIKFEIFDNLLSPKDYESIDKKIFQIGSTWYNHNYFKKIFDYKTVNIAETIEGELVSSLLKFGHRICLLEKIFLEIKPEIVYVSESSKSITKIPSLFTKDYKFEIINLSSKSDERNFRQENYLLSFNILGKNIDIKLSRRNFRKIKKYYELIWKIRFKLSIKINKNKKGGKILLLDFNLITNKSTLQSLSDSEFDIHLANTRRPIIWNNESLKISKELSFNHIEFSLEKHDDKNKLDSILKKMQDFSKVDNFFNEKFMLNNISFWNIFKDDFMKFCEERFSETISFIDSLEKKIVRKNIKLLITLDDYQQLDRAATIFCKNHNIQTIFLRNADLNIFHDGKRDWEIFALKKMCSDKFAIFGELSKKICLDHRINSEKLVITGNPRYDEIFLRKVKVDNNTILITLSGIASTNWSTFYSIPLILKYENMFRQVLKSLTKIDKNIIIKMHPTQDSIINVEKITKEILPNAIILKNANTYDLISESDIVISPPSSVISEALILNKPVFLFKFLEDDTGIPYEKFNAVIATDDEKMIDYKINQILFDNNSRMQLELGRKEFLKYAFDFQGKSSEQVIDLIRKMIP